MRKLIILLLVFVLLPPSAGFSLVFSQNEGLRASTTAQSPSDSTLNTTPKASSAEEIQEMVQDFELLNTQDPIAQQLQQAWANKDYAKIQEYLQKEPERMITFETSDGGPVLIDYAINNNDTRLLAIIVSIIQAKKHGPAPAHIIGANREALLFQIQTINSFGSPTSIAAVQQAFDSFKTRMRQSTNPTFKGPYAPMHSCQNLPKHPEAQKKVQNYFDGLANRTESPERASINIKNTYDRPVLPPLVVVTIVGMDQYIVPLINIKEENVNESIDMSASKAHAPDVITYTPLIAAVVANQLNAVHLLLQEGANTSATLIHNNISVSTVLDLAIKLQEPAIAYTLVKAGAPSSEKAETVLQKIFLMAQEQHDTATQKQILADHPDLKIPAPVKVESASSQ